MEFQREYGVATTIRFPIPKAGSTDLAATGDWTPATGDTKVSKDSGNVANTSNNPSAIGGTGSVLWELTLTAAEMQAVEVTIQIVDSATKAITDQTLIISTRLGAQIAAAKSIYVIACDDTDFTPTTTAAEFTMVAPHLVEEATADHFNGRLLGGTDNVLQGQYTDITDSVLANSKIKLTYTALTEAPTTGDIMVII